MATNQENNCLDFQDPGTMSDELFNVPGFVNELKDHALAVELLPCAEMKKVVHKLKPINDTENCRAEICSTLQVEPELWKRCDIFAATGTRVLSTCGIGMEVHPGGVGEGAWIENDVGGKLLTGEVIESDYTLCKYRVSGDIAPGSYWVVISSRHTQSGKFLSSRRRIVAV